MEGEKIKMNLLTKLVSIRKSVEYIQKTEKGNQGAMYADPAVLIRRIRNKMDELNVLLMPELEKPMLESIPCPTKNNPAATGFLFKSKMAYTFLDADSDDKLKVPWFCTGKHMQDPAMAGGAALTYYERYFLMKFFQIPTSKDDPEFFKQKTAPLSFVDENQKSQIVDIMTKAGVDQGDFLKYLKVESVDKIPVGMMARVMSDLNAVIARKDGGA